MSEQYRDRGEYSAELREFAIKEAESRGWIEVADEIRQETAKSGTPPRYPPGIMPVANSRYTVESPLIDQASSALQKQDALKIQQE